MSFKRNSFFIGTGIILTAGIIACGNTEHHSSSYSSQNEATAEEKRASFERVMTEVELVTVPIRHFDHDASIASQTTGNKTALDLHELVIDKKNSGICRKKALTSLSDPLDISIVHDDANKSEFCPFYYARTVYDCAKENIYSVRTIQESITPDFRKKTGILNMISNTFIPKLYFNNSLGSHAFEIKKSFIEEMVDPNDRSLNSVNFEGKIQIDGHSAQAKVSSDLFLKFKFFESRPGKNFRIFDIEFKALFTNKGARGNREITHPSCTLSGEAISADKCQRYLTQIIALLHIKDLI